MFKLQNYSDKSFVVRGEDTIKIKDTLKYIGGKWNSSLKDGGAWIFSNNQRERVEKLLEVLNTNKSEKVNEPTRGSPKVLEKVVEKTEKVVEKTAQIKSVENKEESTESDTIEINDYTEKTFIVQGNTKDYKDKLKEIGGKWNGFKKFWIFPNSKREEVEKIFSDVDIFYDSEE
jgi:hypothetical protein